MNNLLCGGGVCACLQIIDQVRPCCVLGCYDNTALQPHVVHFLDWNPTSTFIFSSSPSDPPFLPKNKHKLHLTALSLYHFHL